MDWLLTPKFKSPSSTEGPMDRRCGVMLAGSGDNHHPSQLVEMAGPAAGEDDADPEGE